MTKVDVMVDAAQKPMVRWGQWCYSNNCGGGGGGEIMMVVGL